MTADCVCLFTKIISGVNIRWQGCQPDDKPRIYFANHTSHLDTLVIWASLPKELRIKTRPVAAKDYWDKKGIKRYIAQNILNTVLIERQNVSAHDAEHHPVKLMQKALDEKSSLILFPEGTRNQTMDIQPFKSGLYHLCHGREDLELIPVYLENLNRIWPKGEFIVIPFLSSITFGRPLFLEKGETKEGFLTRARHAIEELKHL